ncbi:MAG: hypothetical protein ACOVMK_05685 [Arenimonas sp.]|jgi:hypothetical protein
MNRLLLLSFFLISSTAYAGKTLDSEAIQLSVAAGNIPQQRQQIEAKLAQVEYSELTKESRNELNAQFSALDGLPAGSQEMLSAESRINAILKKAFSDSKLVCTFETPLGSNKKQRTCMTVAAKTRYYNNTQRSGETPATVTVAND